MYNICTIIRTKYYNTKIIKIFFPHLNFFITFVIHEKLYYDMWVKKPNVVLRLGLSLFSTTFHITTPQNVTFFLSKLRLPHSTPHHIKSVEGKVTINTLKNAIFFFGSRTWIITEQTFTQSWIHSDVTILLWNNLHNNILRRLFMYEFSIFTELL